MYPLTPQAFAYLMVELQAGEVSARAWGEAVEWVGGLEGGMVDEGGAEGEEGDEDGDRSCEE